MEKKNERLIRVALIGPESTAKSTLSEALANHYSTVWVPERSRSYLAGRNGYTLEDVQAIAHEQLADENKKLAVANRFLFADTELIIAKVWCEDVFKASPPWISNEISAAPYDLYLLTYFDLPWVADPLRENGDRREFFFNWYRDELEKLKAEYVVIRGEGEERLQACIRAIENFCAGK